MDAPYSILKAKDGSLLLLAAASPIPGGKGYPNQHPGWLMLLMRSRDNGQTWSTVSVIGSNDFDADEGTAGHLPDGSLSFPCRPTSAWFQSHDHGMCASRTSDSGRSGGSPVLASERPAFRGRRHDLVREPDALCGQVSYVATLTQVAENTTIPSMCSQHNSI